MRSGEGRKVVGLSIGVAAVAVPALLAWHGAGLAAQIAYTIVGLGGAIAGRLLVPPGERIRAHLVGMLAGAIAAFGAYATVRWWLGLRASVYAVELMLVTLIGALPGVAIGGLLYGRVRRRDPAVPPATARARESR